MSTRFEHGLALGSFNPPHAGDHALIEGARRLCRRMTVCVLAQEEENFPLPARLLALEEMHPTARIVGGVVSHPSDSGEEAVRRARLDAVRSLVREPIDALFSPGSSGAELAPGLDAAAAAIDVDPDLARLSSADVRRDPAAHWAQLSPAVRGELARRVIVTGSESTGKTTLARRLAERYRTVWVPEFGRELTVVKQQRTFPPEPWQPADFSWIAAEQERQTNEAARRSGPLVIADTDAVATRIWEERYLERASHATERIAAASRGDLYLLAMPDVPWVSDGIRDGDQELREWMTTRIRDLLRAAGRRWVEIEGGWEARERTAVAACDTLLAAGWSFSSPPTARS